MAEQKNVRRKDLREWNYDKVRIKRDRKRSEIQRRRARRQKNEGSF
jgi:hypothetical protein